MDRNLWNVFNIRTDTFICIMFRLYINIYIYNVCIIYVYISYLGVKYISFTIIDFVWGLLVTTQTWSGIGWSRP